MRNSFTISGLVFSVMVSAMVAALAQPAPALFPPRLLPVAATPAPPASPAAPVLPVAPPREATSDSDLLHTEISQIEAVLAQRPLNEVRLGAQRDRIGPLRQRIQDIVQREQPRVEEFRARIEQLGPPPEAGKGTESESVAQARAELQRHLKEADERLRLARAQGLRLDQLRENISDIYRENFTTALFKSDYSILSPNLWIGALQILPTDLRAFKVFAQQWGAAVKANLTWYELILLSVILLGAGVVLPRARRWVRYSTFGLHPTEEGVAEASRFEKVLIALRAFALNGVIPAVFLLLLYLLFREFGLLPGRSLFVARALFSSLALIAGVSAIGIGILAPYRPEARLFALPNGIARSSWLALRHVTLLIALGRFFDALESVIVASSLVVNLTKGLITLGVGLVLLQMMRRVFNDTRLEQEQAQTPAQAISPRALLLVRLAGWGASISILGATLLGFITFASFLIDQLLWLALLATGLVIALVFIEEGLGAGLSSRGGLGKKIRAATGLSASSLDQISVLGAGAARLVLFLMLGVLALAPWGIDSGSFADTMREIFFGFQLGGVTISLSKIILAVVLFLLGFFVTRSIQSWLDKRYLPHTTLDMGLRNSIQTILGYIGVLIASMVAMGQLGVPLEKLTIVAGALSVGIGFGLQSIVNNFVSGLILLWERPIRVGDLIVVSGEQGTVKRINVRATEIRTADRATLIVPNAEFISGRVKNWMLNDRHGRIVIPISVSNHAKPRRVQEVLLNIALAHREVLSDPAPNVAFLSIGETQLEFELRCYADAGAMGAVRSALLFEIFDALQAEGIAYLRNSGEIIIGSQDG